MARGSSPPTTSPRLEVVGRTGTTLHEYWAGEPHAFLGITVPGFPNFFMLYGPGTNGGEIVTMLESQSEYAVRAMKRMRRERVTAIEVRPIFEPMVEPLAPVQDEGDLVDDEQQLLQGAHRQGRHAVADRLLGLPGAHQGVRPRQRNDAPARDHLTEIRVTTSPRFTSLAAAPRDSYARLGVRNNRR